MIRSTLAALTFVTLLTTISLSQLAATPQSLRDVTMSGTAAWHMGSDDEKGTVTLKATRDGKSRMDLALVSDNRSEIRINDPKEPHSFLLSNGKWNESAVHNSWVDADWFFPAFSGLTTGNERGFSQTTSSPTRMRSQFNFSGKRPSMVATIQTLSITDYDLDPSTHLPVKARWVTHPDDDYNKSIPVEVQFSDYRDVNGVEVPFKIQRFFNGTLQLDITLSDVRFNTGLTNSDFVTQ